MKIAITTLVVLLATVCQAQTVTYNIKDVGEISIPHNMTVASGDLPATPKSPKNLKDNFKFEAKGSAAKDPFATVTLETKIGRVGDYPTLATKVISSTEDQKHIDNHFKQIVSNQKGRKMKQWHGAREVKINGRYAIETSFTEQDSATNKMFTTLIIVFQNNDRTHTLTLSYDTSWGAFLRPGLDQVRESFKITPVSTKAATSTRTAQAK